MEMRPAVVHRAKPTPVFEFESLAGLACGCVTAAYHASQFDVTLVSVEAKGPYCQRANHFVGQVLELGETLALCSTDEEE
ncbi:MAG: hypothetical protein JNM38_15355 [Acidobacteria bacterium]|nr:hypothetical protein [Acidobacteriota bacterium]